VQERNNRNIWRMRTLDELKMQRWWTAELWNEKRCIKEDWCISDCEFSIEEDYERED